MGRNPLLVWIDKAVHLCYDKLYKKREAEQRSDMEERGDTENALIGTKRMSA